MTEYLPREVAGRLLTALRHLPVVVLSGMRQTGKSTLLLHEKALAAGRAYRKLHVSDSGLAAHLAGVTEFEPGRDDVLRGALFETYVAQNLGALLEAHLPDAQLSYWHEQGRHEVDFVIESGRKVIAIETKAATRWGESDLSGLRAFLARTPACAAAVLAYNGREAVQLAEKLFAIPLGHLLA